jgi:hypothetical protein
MFSCETVLFGVMFSSLHSILLQVLHVAQSNIGFHLVNLFHAEPFIRERFCLVISLEIKSAGITNG